MYSPAHSKSYLYVYASNKKACLLFKCSTVEWASSLFPHTYHRLCLLKWYTYFGLPKSKILGPTLKTVRFLKFSFTLCGSKCADSTLKLCKVVDHLLFKHSINFSSKLISIIEVMNNVMNNFDKMDQLFLLILWIYHPAL